MPISSALSISKHPIQKIKHNRISGNALAAKVATSPIAHRILVHHLIDIDKHEIIAHCVSICRFPNKEFIHIRSGNILVQMSKIHILTVCLPYLDVDISTLTSQDPV